MRMTRAKFEVQQFHAAILAEEGEDILDITITAHHHLVLTDRDGNPTTVTVDAHVPVSRPGEQDRLPGSASRAAAWC